MGTPPASVDSPAAPVKLPPGSFGEQGTHIAADHVPPLEGFLEDYMCSSAEGRPVVLSGKLLLAFVQPVNVMPGGVPVIWMEASACHAGRSTVTPPLVLLHTMSHAMPCWCQCPSAHMMHACERGVSRGG